MPAKQIFILNKDVTGSTGGDLYTVAFWADVPGGNQFSYKNPQAKSQYKGCSSLELAALKDGVVAEKVTSYTFATGTAQSVVDAALQGQYTAYQTAITNATPFAAYGRYFNGTVWTTGPVIETPLSRLEAEQPTIFALSPVSAFAANKFHFVLYNSAAYIKVRILLVILQPQATVVTGVLSSAWTLRRRQALTTPPGGGTFTGVLADSQHVLPAGITLHNAPTTAPAGGTLDDFLSFFPPADEVKVATADTPGLSSIASFGGMAVYDASMFRPSVPLIIRTGQTLEIQQSATAGASNARVFCIFTLEDER